MRWLFALIALGIPLLSHAGEATASAGILGIRGTAGASVRIDGEPAGTLPVGEIALPYGMHVIRLSKRGYETREERVWLRPERGESRVIYLHAKRKRDALWRSILVPGWGAYYTDRPARALLTLAVELGMLGYAYHQDGVFEERKDDYEDASLAYRRATTDEAIAAARAERDDAYDRMESAESNRDRALLAAAVVYGFSALDAIMTFPYGDDPDGGRVALQPGFSEHGGGSSLALRISF
ncbi:MAG: DUF5683 domain-containing protein [Candidatus Eisenbacteria bacterium]